MNVLIIGGTGTISRAIVQALLRRGHSVTLYNRGLRADPPPAEVRVIIGDRRDRPAFEAALQHESFDAVIDMISYTADDAASALSALRGRVGHFIQTSTVMTYGPPFTGLYQDETAPLYGRNDGGYGENKVAADELLMRAFVEEQFPVTIVKPSFTYGPGHPLWRQTDWHTDWIDRLRKHKPLLVVGDGLNYFQFLPAPDAAEAFAGLLGHPQALGKIVNLANPQPITWIEWHQAGAAALGIEAELVGAPAELLIATNPERYGSLRANFAHSQIFRNAELERLLPAWQPTTDRHTHLQATIEWMDRHNRVANSDDDTLEDRIIAALRELPERVRFQPA
ncbi:MAG: NAD-dependent epimerase/dehydratase family protein [Roseiflexaceae bacterium]|nr:NAD-dependent epimerase/dehydratase family protein [Roseiflexaceae bacterium]